MTPRELSEDIARLVDEGLSASEIGQRLAIPRHRVIRIASRFKIRLQPRGGVRRIGAKFSASKYEVIAALAKGAKVSIATMLVRIADVVIGEGQQIATRRLGTAARPKRSWQRRK